MRRRSGLELIVAMRHSCIKRNGLAVQSSQTDAPQINGLAAPSRGAGSFNGWSRSSVCPVPTNPAASDGLNNADDHMRLIKSALQGTFPGATGALTTAAGGH